VTALVRSAQLRRAARYTVELLASYIVQIERQSRHMSLPPGARKTVRDLAVQAALTRDRLARARGEARIGAIHRQALGALEVAYRLSRARSVELPPSAGRATRPADACLYCWDVVGLSTPLIQCAGRAAPICAACRAAVARWWDTASC
jgi:hypothetical protein